MIENEKTVATTGSEEFIAFRIGDQEFCIEITTTREIRGWSKATGLPSSPDYMVGVINLRGAILPIIDLAARLGLEPSEQNDRSVIIVAKIEGKLFGLLVDSVSDIIDVSPDDLLPVPELNMTANVEFFKRVILLDKRIVIEIELETLIDFEDLKVA